MERNGSRANSLLALFHVTLCILIARFEAHAHQGHSIAEFIEEIVKNSAICKSTNINDLLNKIGKIDQRVGDYCDSDHWIEFIKPFHDLMNETQKASSSSCDTVKKFAAAIADANGSSGIEKLELKLCLSKSFNMKCHRATSKCECFKTEIENMDEHDHDQHHDHDHKGHRHHKRRSHKSEESESGAEICRILPHVEHHSAKPPGNNGQKIILGSQLIFFIMALVVVNYFFK